MSTGKVQTHRSRGRNVAFYVINVTPAEFHNGEKLIAHQRQHFRTILYDDFPELLQPVNSPHVSQQTDHPIELIGPMKCHRLNMLSLAECAEISRKLKDAMEVGSIRPCHNEFGSPNVFVRTNDGSFRLDMDYHGLHEVTLKDAYPLMRVDDTLDELKDASFYTHLAYGF
jgi:hypothetical protein